MKPLSDQVADGMEVVRAVAAKFLCVLLVFEVGMELWAYYFF